MQFYRFSPIQSKEQMLAAVQHIHFAGYQLCEKAFGRYFANAQNMGIFCHYDEEYEFLTKVRQELTEASDNIRQKYFRLREPIVIPAKGKVAATTYSYLYIRRPDPYRHHVGDIDFYLPEKEYADLKATVKNGVSGARIFDRSDLDMIELYNPDIDVLAYVSTSTIAESVRVKLSEATKL